MFFWISELYENCRWAIFLSCAISSSVLDELSATLAGCGSGALRCWRATRRARGQSATNAISARTFQALWLAARLRTQAQGHRCGRSRVGKRRSRARADRRTAAAISRPSRIHGFAIRRVGKTASRSRPFRLRTSEGGRRLGREAPENGRAAESRLVRAKTCGARGGRAEDRPGRRGRPAVARRRGAGLCSPAPAAGVGSLLASDLSATALDGLAMLAARLSAATILFGAVFVPSDNRIVEEGRIPGRPDIAYRWAHAESATAVTLKVLIDGQWRTLADGGAAPDGVVYDRDGRAVARVVSGPDRRQTLVATVDALDRAVADLRRKDGEPAAAPIGDDREPKLCPDPTEEPKTTKSANSIAYQEYVSKLPYGWAIVLGIVRFDGCDPETGFLLEAKANIDHLFDANDVLFSWVYPENDPEIQMKSSSGRGACRRPTGRLARANREGLSGIEKDR